MPAPSLEQLLAGASCPGWLADDWAQAQARGSSFFQAAALGLVLRLWSPADPREAGEHLSRALSGRQLPSARARAWCEGLPRAAAARAAREARSRARALSAEAESLETVRLSDRAAWREGVLAIAVARDELECVAAALAHTREAGELADALAGALSELDQRWGDTLRRHLGESHLASVPGRLLAVGWQEPEAWWGMTLDSPCTTC